MFRIKSKVYALFTATLLVAIPLSSVAKSQDGWRDLFNGKDLSGWQAKYIKNHQHLSAPPESFFQVIDGVIHAYADKKDQSKQPFVSIETKESFNEYRFSVDYKWGTAKFQPRHKLLRDAGILYHAHGMGRPAWQLSVESQIQEGDSGDIYSIGTLVSTYVDPSSFLYNPKGSVSSYNYLPDNLDGELRTIGNHGKVRRVIHNNMLENDGWNTMEVVVRGDKAIHLVNGKINNRSFNFKRFDETSQSWQPLTQGKIVLQAEGAEVFYRNIKIRPLNDSDPY